MHKIVEQVSAVDARFGSSSMLKKCGQKVRTEDDRRALHSRPENIVMESSIEGEPLIIRRPRIGILLLFYPPQRTSGN